MLDKSHIHLLFPQTTLLLIRSNALDTLRGNYETKISSNMHDTNWILSRKVPSYSTWCCYLQDYRKLTNT